MTTPTDLHATTTRPSLPASTASKALPTLAHHVDTHPCAPVSLVLVTHLLDTAVPFLRLLGQAVELQTVIAIPYSTTAAARAALASELPVVEPAGLDELPLTLSAGIAAAARRQKRFVVQEIGGWCAPLLDASASQPGFSGVVEDTMQGHWRYAALGALPCPVLSIADSPLKGLENRQVGRSISFALERTLRTRFYRILSEVRVGVLGYGGIGEATAMALAAHGAQVQIFDPKPLRMVKAVVDGIRAVDRSTLLATSDVIVGVSGQRSLSADDVSLLRDGAILASGSSKQVELDVTGLFAPDQVVIDGDDVAELRVQGKQLFVLNRGMPVNFSDLSVLGRVLDLVYTELYMCIRKLSVGGCPPGLQRLETREHEAIAETWRSLYGERA